jgi:hypothetical protein
MYCTLGDTPNAAVYAKSVKQKVVATSSTEAELVATAYALSYALWFRNFLNELHVHQPETGSVIYNDNKSTIYKAHQRPRHERKP